MILVIDNYDSFTYNLVDYCGKIYSDEILVYRNDKITCDEIKDLNPSYIIISPGPKTPQEAGISKQVIETFYKDIPIFGVCLGHQAIGEVFGGDVIRAKNLMHGKTSFVSHSSHPLFKDVSNPFIATRYHSLVLKKETIPESLEVIAYSDDDCEIMAVAHREYPVWGVQFHPESICTDDGLQLLKNFLSIK